jgi:hypothetical protein
MPGNYSSSFAPLTEDGFFATLACKPCGRRCNIPRVGVTDFGI